MYMALRFSQKMTGDLGSGIRRSRSRYVNQVTSAAVCAIAQYSTSVEDLEMVFFFLGTPVDAIGAIGAKKSAVFGDGAMGFIDT